MKSRRTIRCKELWQLFLQSMLALMVFVTVASAQSVAPQTATQLADSDSAQGETEESTATTSSTAQQAGGLIKKQAKVALRPSGIAVKIPNPFDPPKAKPSEAQGGQTPDPKADAAALAKKLSNPVASLVSLPLQSNFDFGLGPTGDGFKYTLNVQPVIPISLNKDWNLISRTIIPIIAQKDVVANGTSQFGLGDIAQAFFFSPNKSEPFVWGLGPQVLIPTATNEFLGAKNLAIGPTGLILKQRGHWTVGALAGHLWTVARSSSRSTLSITNLQPFISYSTKTAWTYGMSAETTYDWKNDQWNVPIFFNVSKLVRFGKQPVSIGGSLKCWAASSPTGPEGCGIRVTITPLFPKK